MQYEHPDMPTDWDEFNRYVAMLIALVVVGLATVLISIIFLINFVVELYYP